MGNRLGESLTAISAQVALDSTGDKFTFAPGRPVRIFRYGYVWNAAVVTAPENLDLNLDKRVTIGSDTGRTEKAEIAGVSGEAQGSGGYGNLATPVDLDADEEAVIEVSVAATAGDGYVFVEYQPLPFVAPKLGGLTSKTVT